MRRRVLGLIVLALAAAARAEVDVDVAPPLHAQSSLSPAGEVETYRFHATKGASLSLAIAAKRGVHLTFAPVLTDPAGHAVDLGAKGAGARVNVRNLRLGSTGTYRLDVAAAGTGVYALSLAATPQAKFARAFDLAPAASSEFAFSAPPGSAVTFSAKAARGSQATPRFGSLSGQDFALSLGSLGKPTPTSHVVSVTSVGGTGDLTVDVTNAGAVAGAIDATVTVRPPKVKSLKLDLRGAALGRPAGGETAVIHVVGPTGGVVAVTGATSDLNGASVSLPPGALDAPLPISISSADAPPLPDEDSQFAGPAVDLEPSGTTFNSAVSVTLPFDYAQLPALATPDDIFVYVVEEDGSTSKLVPSSVDPGDGVRGTVTVSANGFSKFIAAVPAGMRRIGLTQGGDKYWALTMKAEMTRDNQQDDSRSRSYSLAIGEVTFLAGHTFQLSTEERTVGIENPDHVVDPNDINDLPGGVDGAVLGSAAPQIESGTWVYGADGQSVALTSSDQKVAVLSVNRDNSVMAGRGRGVSEARAEVSVLLRKNTGPITVKSLAGTYHMVVTGIDGRKNGAPRTPATIGTDHQLGTLSFDGKGHCRIVVKGRKTRFDSGAWKTTAESADFQGTYAVEAAGTVLVTLPPGSPGDPPDALRFYPGAGATVFLGGNRDFSGDNTTLLVLVKQGSGLSPKSLVGAYRGETFQVDAEQSYSVGGVNVGDPPPVKIGDPSVSDEHLAMTFNGTASVQIDSTQHEVLRSDTTAGGVAIVEHHDQFGVTVTVDSKGAFRLSDQGGALAGFLAPDAGIGVLVSEASESSGEHTIGFLVRSPPAK